MTKPQPDGSQDVDTGTNPDPDADVAPIPIASLTGDPIRDMARTQLPPLCEAYRTNQDQIDALTKVNKALMAQIAPIAEAAGLRKVDGEGWNLRTGRGGRTDVDRTKLAEAGVPMEVIEACTSTSTWTYYMVLRPGKGKGQKVKE